MILFVVENNPEEHKCLKYYKMNRTKIQSKNVTKSKTEFCNEFWVVIWNRSSKKELMD